MLPKNGALFLYSPEVTSHSRCFREKKHCFLSHPNINGKQQTHPFETIDTFFAPVSVRMREVGENLHDFSAGDGAFNVSIGILILGSLYAPLLLEL